MTIPTHNSVYPSWSNSRDKAINHYPVRAAHLHACCPLTCFIAPEYMQGARSKDGGYCVPISQFFVNVFFCIVVDLLTKIPQPFCGRPHLIGENLRLQSVIGLAICSSNRKDNRTTTWWISITRYVLSQPARFVAILSVGRELSAVFSHPSVPWYIAHRIALAHSGPFSCGTWSCFHRKRTS